MLRSYFQCFAYDQEISYLRRTHKKRSQSFVQAFLKLSYCYLSTSAGNIAITDIDGSDAPQGGGTGDGSAKLYATAAGRGGGSIRPYYNAASNSEPTNSYRLGIVVGTGTTSVTPQDYALATQITDGTTSGKLEYFTCAGSSLTISAPTGSFTLERLFRNSSGASITINEVGIYVGAKSFADNDEYCAIRDLVSPGFAVANGEYMRVVYTISVTA